MNISGVEFESMVDGEGCRCTIFVSGCDHHCKGCQNPSTWDHCSGIPLTQNMIDYINAELDKRPFLSGVTFSGGDPFYHINEVVEMKHKLHIPKNNTWIYTGFTLEELQKNFDMNMVKKEFDVIVDGRYVEELRDITLPFRGSSNQKIIYTRELA